MTTSCSFSIITRRRMPVVRLAPARRAGSGHFVEADDIKGTLARLQSSDVNETVELAAALPGMHVFRLSYPAARLDKMAGLRTQSTHSSSSTRLGSNRNSPRSGGPPRLGPIDNNDAFADDLAVKVRPKTKKPPMYRVLLLNDDFTPMEFVTYVLERVFNRSHQDALDIMLNVHQTGIGTAGVYTYEIAETKVDQVMLLARQHEHPLQCTMERET